MKTLSLYRIDRWDGAERQIPTQFHFENKAEAERQKGQHDTISTITLTIIEPGETLGQAQKQSEAAAAVAKLTPKERVLVGLPEDLQEAIKIVTDKIAKSALA